MDGVDTYPAKDDRGYEWWTGDGHLVLEEPQYCADADWTIGSWIEGLTKWSPDAAQ